MAALPMPPASHQCRKSHCSSKSARWQTWPRCDLTDHHKGSERAGGTPVVVSGAAPRLPKWGRAAGRASTALVPCLSSSCCQANVSAARTNYFPGLNPLGKLFTPGQLTATKDLPQTAGLLPPCLARGTIPLGIRPYFLCASRSLAQSVARSYTRAVCCWASSFGSHNL